MGHFKKPGCEKPFGRSEYVQFIPACMRDEVDPNCAPCTEDGGVDAAILSTPDQPNFDFPSTRLVIDRRELLENSLSRLGTVGFVQIIPSVE